MSNAEKILKCYTQKENPSNVWYLAEKGENGYCYYMDVTGTKTIEWQLHLLLEGGCLREISEEEARIIMLV